MDPIPAANPYETPGAPLADHIGVEGFIPNGRQVPAGHGSAWWGSGWQLMKKDFWPWVGAFVVFMLITIVLGAIPVVGRLGVVLQPILLGGLFMGARASAEGGRFTFAHLFAGFQNHAGQLALIGVFFFVAVLLLGLGAAALGFGGAMAAGGLGMTNHGVAAAGVGGLFFFAIFVVAFGVMILVSMAYWMAPTLVVNHGLSAFDAMKTSFTVATRNLGAFFIFGVIGIGLAFCCIFTVFIGFLVVWPVGLAASYMASRDLFIQEP